MGEHEAGQVNLFAELQLLFEQMAITFSSMDVSWEMRLRLRSNQQLLTLRIITPGFSTECAPGSRRVVSLDIPFERIWRAQQADQVPYLWNNTVKYLKQSL